MRIKDYADSKGVTSQTIYKKMRSQKYKDRLKGHLYQDNEKVENIDLVGIKILEDYHFENDVAELEETLKVLEEKHKQEKEILQLIVDEHEQENAKLELRLEKHKSEKKNMQDRIDTLVSKLDNSLEQRYDLLEYIKALERQKIILVVIIAVLLVFLIVIWLDVF
ncbi:Uncharacterised protein [Streptococcus gallolyticus]|uniref:Uncharacterized protein n=1 Tax=Streptococcus gallolyticus TaxID=315405 RepID=A0AA94S9Q8_9STRE|nr:hypothetical protein [Streptococcus gallolyticus]AQP41248.1 hypothetical protein BTR42_01225 [Streptococcus gallolyticus subsp. gallolyticus DSM 16831]SQG78528.1 Uncharacterised protein [Streptococcus gallolyticus]